jgi:hypothetical protein
MLVFGLIRSPESVKNLGFSVFDATSNGEELLGHYDTYLENQL